ncbi:hypothetical protein CEXT_814921 [Caerostris extrusa]|uniref:Uncharacterized protein n=1 Tax=Caerostris extrusa TaxID=172846 RepID=A0AAV4VRY3_CAEEX|nr:hypothetical protein CEXT_814921 [Caerostris extrusa]
MVKSRSGGMVNGPTHSTETAPVCQYVGLHCRGAKSVQRTTWTFGFDCCTQTFRVTAVLNTIDSLILSQKLNEKRPFIKKKCQRHFAFTLHHTGFLRQC